LGQVSFVFVEGEEHTRSDEEVRILQGSLEKGGWEGSGASSGMSP
jgi:hypothetical protein